MHSTNYTGTFIAVAPDSTATAGTVPPTRRTPSVAERTFAMVAEHPYEHTSDEILFTICADRTDIPEEAREDAKNVYFSKGQPCFRASPLTKTCGWGVHFDADGVLRV